jgi:hypothetical protein
MPFVQGHYTNAAASVHVDSTCACCDDPIAFDVDSEMRFRVEGDLEPLIFVKRVDFEKLEDPSIIDAF